MWSRLHAACSHVRRSPCDTAGRRALTGAADPSSAPAQALDRLAVARSGGGVNDTSGDCGGVAGAMVARRRRGRRMVTQAALVATTMATGWASLLAGWRLPGGMAGLGVAFVGSVACRV